MESIAKIFESLDAWINEENLAARREGFPEIKRCEFRVVGQAALIDAGLEFEVSTTADLDAFTNASHAIICQLERLLAVNGMKYDLLSGEIWMPSETIYKSIFAGDWVKAYRADVDYVMLSKAKLSMQKNKVLLQDYLASSPSNLFFELCAKYGVDLEKVLKG